MSPMHLSRQQDSESVWVSLMNKTRGPEDSREAPRVGGSETNSSWNDWMRGVSNYKHDVSQLPAG